MRPGELVAVTGPTGSGKTTLLRILAGLLPPGTGTVRFGGRPLEEADTAEVHARLGYVPQRPVTVSGTLADNLRLGSAHTDDELRSACRTAALDDYLDSAPDGLDTLVGERGSTLSGGQLQRLALARAVLRKPPSCSSTTSPPRSTRPPNAPCWPGSAPGPARPRSSAPPTAAASSTRPTAP